MVANRSIGSDPASRRGESSNRKNLSQETGSYQFRLRARLNGTAQLPTIVRPEVLDLVKDGEHERWQVTYRLDTDEGTDIL